MLTDYRIHYFQFFIVTFKCHMCSSIKTTFQELQIPHHIIPMFLENQKTYIFFWAKFNTTFYLSMLSIALSCRETMMKSQCFDCTIVVIREHVKSIIKSCFKTHKIDDYVKCRKCPIKCEMLCWPIRSSRVDNLKWPLYRRRRLIRQQIDRQNYWIL